MSKVGKPTFKQLFKSEMNSGIILLCCAAISLMVAYVDHFSTMLAMSLFISILSFNDQSSIAGVKFAILCTSILSGIVGFFYLKNLKKMP